MKLSITICRPCKAKCLYDFTGNIESVYETHIVELYNLPNSVISAINEEEGKGCVCNISFIKED